MKIEKVEKHIWTPVKTKPRQEKKLLNYSEKNSVLVYLPLYKRVKRYDRKIVKHWLPMFPGYVFVCLNEKNFSLLLRSGAIVYRIAMTELSEKRLIEDLQALKKFEDAAFDKDLIVKPEVVNGRRVSISGGPFTGLQGIVQKRKNKFTVTVNINILGQSVSTVMDIEDVELDDL